MIWVVVSKQSWETCRGQIILQSLCLFRATVTSCSWWRPTMTGFPLSGCLQELLENSLHGLVCLLSSAPLGKSLCLPKPVAPSGSSATPSCSTELHSSRSQRRTLQTQPMVNVVCPCLTSANNKNLSRGFPHFFSQEREKNRMASRTYEKARYIIYYMW